MTAIVILFGLWVVCAFVLGLFWGRFIKVGMTDPAEILPFPKRGTR